MASNQDLYEEGQKVLKKQISTTGNQGRWLGVIVGIVLSCIAYYNSFWESTVSTVAFEACKYMGAFFLIISLGIYVTNVPKNVVEIQKEGGLRYVRYLGWKLGFLTNLLIFIAIGIGVITLFVHLGAFINFKTKTLFIVTTIALLSLSAWNYAKQLE